MRWPEGHWPLPSSPPLPSPLCNRRSSQVQWLRLMCFNFEYFRYFHFFLLQYFQYFWVLSILSHKSGAWLCLLCFGFEYFRFFCAWRSPSLAKCNRWLCLPMRRCCTSGLNLQGGRGNKSGNKNCRRNREISTENESFVKKTHKERRATVMVEQGCELGKSFAEMFCIGGALFCAIWKPEWHNFLLLLLLPQFLVKEKQDFLNFWSLHLHCAPPVRILTKLFARQTGISFTKYGMIFAKKSLEGNLRKEEPCRIYKVPQF